MDQKFNIMCLDYTPDGSKFATAGNDFHVKYISPFFFTKNP